MKTLTSLVALLLLILNFGCGILLPDYEKFNIIVTSIVIVINTILVLIALSILKDAFKISLSFLFSFLCVVENVLAILSPNMIEDNLYILGICIILTLQLIILISVKFCQR